MCVEPDKTTAQTALAKLGKRCFGGQDGLILSNKYPRSGSASKMEAVGQFEAFTVAFGDLVWQERLWAKWV